MLDRSVVITGSASGMGAASAREFAEDGAKVTILDMNETLSQQVAAEIGAENPIIGDISDSHFCNKVIESTIERYGSIDVLVNCAGTILRANSEDTTDADWERVMSTNVNGVFFMSRAAIKPMKKRGKGVIINFGAIWVSILCFLLQFFREQMGISVISCQIILFFMISLQFVREQMEI